MLGLSFSNLLHLSRRGLTSFERRFFKEFEEVFSVLVMTASSFFDKVIQSDGMPRMVVSPQLHVAVPDIEKLADLFMLLLPIFCLTRPGPLRLHSSR
jgi:hypothetical protein